jgi:hypothetical protein
MNRKSQVLIALAPIIMGALICLAVFIFDLFFPIPAGAAGYRLLPECTIQAVVGQDFTQLDLVWLDGTLVEYAYPTQYQAAQRISLIEQEFACNVKWEAA